MHLELCVTWYILDEVTGLNIMAINLKLILYFHLVSIKLELVSIPKYYYYCCYNFQGKNMKEMNIFDRPIKRTATQPILNKIKNFHFIWYV